MRWVSALILIFSASAAFAQAAARTYMTLADLPCSAPASEDCYRDAFAYLSNHQPSAPESLSHGPGYWTFLVNNSSLYSIKGMMEKSDDITITIHGLWSNALQLNSSLDLATKNDRFGSVIELTLPGHYGLIGVESFEKADQRPPKASANDWVRALDSTIKVAQRLGRNVHVIGQSTGGLLAVLAAVKYPGVIKSVVLIEPALRVQSKWSYLTCSAGAFVSESPWVRRLVALTQQTFVNAQNYEMGCEVSKLSDAVLRAYAPEKTVSSLAKKVRVPVYIFNNEHDGIVSTSAVREFYNALPGWKRYQSINVKGIDRHGQVSEHRSAIAAALAEVRALGIQEPSAKSIYAKQVASFLDQIAKVKPSPGQAWSLSVQKLITEGELARRSCQFLPARECAAVNSALQELTKGLETQDVSVFRKALSPLAVFRRAAAKFVVSD